LSTQRRNPRWKLSRDAVLFASGLAGIAYETITNHGDRPTLLILFGGMVGLPALLRQDERLSASPKRRLPPVEEEDDPIEEETDTP
jgi:hypothetical protein